MSGIEPGWGCADSNLHEGAADAPIDLILPVALGSRLRKSWGEVRARSFEGKGTVQIGDTSVTIRTSVSRLFGEALRSELTLRREDIYNVRVNQKLVQFDLLNGPGELEPVILRLDNREDAASLAAALPDQTTRTYATGLRAESLFLAQMQERTPYVWATWTIVAINSLVFVVMVASGAGLLRVNPGAAIAAGSNFGPDTQGGQWWRLLSAVFIHFGLVHIVFNMLVLVQNGRLAERVYGSVRFIAIYLFAGILGSEVSLLWHPGVNSAGASGAIFGVIGAVLAWLVHHRDTVPRGLYVKHFRVTGSFVVYTLVVGFTHAGVDNGAHLGGLLGGFLLGLLLVPPPIDSSSGSNVRSALAIGAPAVLACGVVVCMAWLLATLSSLPERQQAMQFAEVLREASDVEQHVAAQLRALPRERSTPEGRAVFVQQIRGTVLPEWRHLDTILEGTQALPDSANAKLRARLMTYYDDMTLQLEMMANMAEQNRMNDPASVAALKAAMANTRSARAAVFTR